jgi:branched-chain amino acid transport system ATP-binding protein
MTQMPSDHTASSNLEETSGDILLEVVGVTSGYGRTVVIRDINMTVHGGQVVALVGINGSGKSTTLRTLSGLLRVKSGSIRYNGVDISTLSAHERSRMGICHITDTRAIFPDLTVEENIRLHVGAKRSALKAAMEQATAAFPKLGERRRQSAGTLSGGEQQMLALARAFVTRPKLLLLDELSTGLAPIVIDEIYQAITALVSTGISTIIVEQYVKRIIPLADVMYVMARGEMSEGEDVGDVVVADLVDSYLKGRLEHD